MTSVCEVLKTHYSSPHKQITALFRDECISVILFGLAHVKTMKARVETLKSVFSNLGEWPGDNGSKKLADDIIENPIA